MRILKAVFQDGEDFLRSYDSSFAYGGTFIPTRKPIPVGEMVAVAVQIGKRKSPLLLRSTVAWRRRGRHKEKIRAGLGIEFHASERLKRDFLLSIARGEATSAVPRRHVRIPVDLPVSWRPLGAPAELPGTVRDIGRGGAMVVPGNGTSSTGMSLRMLRGSDLTLSLVAPGSVVATPVVARVAWVREDNGEAGFGVSWRSRDAGGSRRIRELVRRLSSGTG